MVFPPLTWVLLIVSAVLCPVGFYKFVYFIDTHEKTKKFKICLSDEYKDIGSLEKIKDLEVKKDPIEFASEVYRFKIVPGSLKKEDDQKYQILVSAEEEDGKKHQYSIKFLDETKDFYQYDFNIEELDFQPLSHEEQFEIYVEILRKTCNKKQNTAENDYLIQSTHHLLDEEGKKYNFFFYLLIFLECYRTNSIQQHLLKFKPEKIEGLGTFPEAKLKVIKNILKALAKNPSKSMNLQGSGNESELNELFYSILLFFNMNFQKELVVEMFKDDKILTYLSKKLISFHNLYKGLVLEKDIVRKLINKAKTFDEILGYLPYIGTDIIEFLQLIYNEMNFIKQIYENEWDKLNEENEGKDKKDQKQMKKIEVEQYVLPKKSDNIQKLFEVASLIFVTQKLNNMEIIKFSKTLIGKYIEFYNEKSMDGLQLINNLINLIKKNDLKFEFKYNDKDMDFVIHETGIALIKKGEMKNNEILDFIKSDIYYNSNQYDKSFYRPLDILDKIDIEKIDDKFFVTWITMKFNNIFGKTINNFYNKITGLIKNMKDFGLLYRFFLYDNNKDYKTDVLKIMKKRYIDLLPTLQYDNCPNFVQDTIKLIYLIDQKKLDSRDLLKLIQDNLDHEKVNDLYLKLTEQHKDLNDKTKDCIAAYFTTDKNNINYSSLIYLIKNCKNLRKEIFSKINNYIITENDFLSLEETENYKLYKGLIDNKIIDKEFAYKGATYVTKAQMTISSLEEKIKKFEIKYSEISVFFQNEKNKNILKERLLYLNILDENKQQKSFAYLEQKYKEIKNKIDDLELIYSDFRDFFYQKHEQDLKKLTEICFHLKNESLNYYEKNVVEDYKNYSKYLDEAKKRQNLKRSTFFNEILKYNQKIVFKNSEDKALEETEKTFKNLKKIFEREGISKINEKIVSICIHPFLENEENLKIEIKTLSEIFGINAKLDEIYEAILLFSKRGLIFDIANALHIFISVIKSIKTNFSKCIEDIIASMKENKGIQTIKFCNNMLKDLKIFDGKERENKLLNILIKFKEQPDSIQFLFKTTAQDITNLQEIASSNDKNNFVTVNDILDLGKCVEFFKTIGTLDQIKGMEDSVIYEKMKNKVKEKEDISVLLERYVNNFSQIKLLETSVDKTKFLKYQIQTLFKGCEFILSNEKEEISKNRELLFKCTCINENVIYSRDDIISLRDRALLAKKKTSEYKYFTDSISEIINISNILKELYIRGYPKIINIKILYKVDFIIKSMDETEINPHLKFYFDNKNKNSFKEILSELKKIFEELKEKQLEAYKTKPLIRYIYGRQFNLLKNISDKNKVKQLEPLLKYITNDSYKKKVEKFNLSAQGDLIQDNINNWNYYLEKVLKSNSLDLKKIYEAKDKKGGELLIIKYFFDIWNRIYNNVSLKVPENTRNNHHLAILKEMISFIHERYKEKITLVDICNAGGVGKTMGTNIFNMYVNKTPGEFLKDYRIQRSIKLLQETDMTITEICYETGFAGASYFAETFKKQMGVSPLNFRKEKAQYHPLTHYDIL